MRMRTTDVEVGTTYEHCRDWLDVMNTWLMPGYPTGRGIRWFLSRDETTEYPISRPPPRCRVTALSAEVACEDEATGRVRIPTNSRGRPFVAVRDGAGGVYLPVDPQVLYPLDDPPGSAAGRVLTYAYWIFVFPALILALMIGGFLFFDTTSDSGTIEHVVGLGLLGVGLAILLHVVSRLRSIRAERIREGAWAASVRLGLKVGVVLAVAELIRQIFHLGR